MQTLLHFEHFWKTTDISLTFIAVSPNEYVEGRGKSSDSKCALRNNDRPWDPGGGFVPFWPLNRIVYQQNTVTVLG